MSSDVEALGDSPARFHSDWLGLPSGRKMSSGGSGEEEGVGKRREWRGGSGEEEGGEVGEEEWGGKEEKTKLLKCIFNT